MWSWRGAAALILSTCVGVGFLCGMVAVAFQTEPITTQGAALLNTLGGALIGAVAGWLGGTAHQEGKTMTTNDDAPQDLEVEPQEPAVPVVPGRHREGVDADPDQGDQEPGDVPQAPDHQG